MDEGEVPGEVIGQIDAADVQFAMEELARISEENDLPPKMLIVHQFVESSITNREHRSGSRCAARFGDRWLRHSGRQAFHLRAPYGQ